MNDQTEEEKVIWGHCVGNKDSILRPVLMKTRAGNMSDSSENLLPPLSCWVMKSQGQQEMRWITLLTPTGPQDTPWKTTAVSTSCLFKWAGDRLVWVVLLTALVVVMGGLSGHKRPVTPLSRFNMWRFFWCVTFPVFAWELLVFLNFEERTNALHLKSHWGNSFGSLRW